MTTPTNGKRETPPRAGSTLPWPTRHAPAILLTSTVIVAAVTAYGITKIVRRGWATLTPSTAAGAVASPPTLASMEARVRTEHDLRERERTGIPTGFALVKGGGGERLILPPNSAGITEVIVELDPSGRTVWLAYGGEVTGKGTRELPGGAVEQLVRDRPTVLRFTFSSLTVSPLRGGGEISGGGHLWHAGDRSSPGRCACPSDPARRRQGSHAPRTAGVPAGLWRDRRRRAWTDRRHPACLPAQRSGATEWQSLHYGERPTP